MNCCTSSPALKQPDQRETRELRRESFVTAVVLAALALFGATLVSGLLGVNTLPFDITKGYEHIAGLFAIIIQPFAYGLAAISGIFLIKSGYLHCRNI